MKTEKNIETDLDEVIFEKRNKEYGAYFLRKTYEKNVTRALTVTITLVLLIVVIPLIANYISDDRFFRGTSHNGTEVIVLNNPKEEIKPLPPLPPLKDLTNKAILKEFKIIDTASDLDPIPTQGELNEQKTNEPIDENEIKVDPDQKDKKVIDINPDNE